MKKVLTFIAVGALLASASADITSFQWSGGTLNNASNVKIAYGAGTVLTVLDTDSNADILSYISGNQINIADLQLFTAINVQGHSGAPVGPNFNTGYITQNDASRVGLYAWAIATDGVFADINSITVGTMIGITSVGGAIIDQQPGGAGPIGTGQSFNPGVVTTNIEVIPEPATIGLMGVAGLGMFLARRKARR